MNAVRKHVTRIKGGRLAQAFHGKAMISLIISDVVGDPLDVIASGPTAPDPSTFAGALAVLERYGLSAKVSPAVAAHLHRGAAGRAPETLKEELPWVHHEVVANAETALAAARSTARGLGYSVNDLGLLHGPTAEVVEQFASNVERGGASELHLSRKVCHLAGGETTVHLAPDHGLGGRNQEFVLTLALRLDLGQMADTVVFSAGTDGEDGPTDAAGAFADATTFERAGAQGLEPRSFLGRHDAYHFFQATGDLFKPGLTETNVMDVRLVVTGPPVRQGAP
jgi:glycerate 2-kinase